eukprot:COSAG02_NODE_66021_length_256_cov_0.993631_1_plen_57_part_10
MSERDGEAEIETEVAETGVVAVTEKTAAPATAAKAAGHVQRVLLVMPNEYVASSKKL